MSQRYAFSVTRLEGNPILYRGSTEGVGVNVNGPSLIRAPSWVAQPLGRYYLYFAHHRGKSIRLAVADSLSGPWRVVPGGALSLADSGFPADGVRPHIASPDVHVDESTQTVSMYFHGHETGTREQFTRLAVSGDGVNFSAVAKNLGPAYLRVFAWDGAYYAVGRSGWLYRSADGVSAFERGPRVLDPATRHVAALRRGADLLAFFSRIGDAPERILCRVVSLDDDWQAWSAGEPVEVLAPESEWEGADLPVLASERAWADERVHQLRDPAIFEEDGELFLLFSAAGESGIGIARLEVSELGPIRAAASGVGAGVGAAVGRLEAVVRRVDPGYTLARQAVVTLIAVLASFGSALALRYAAGLTASVEVLAVALAMSLSRIGARPEHRGWRARALGLCVLPLVAVLASEIGMLLFQHADLGDALFVLGVSVTIYVRRFGDVARRVATFAVLPLISTLIVPGPVIVGAGASGSGGAGRWWAALVALIALAWVSAVRAGAIRIGWIVDDAVAPARPPQRRRSTAQDGGRRRLLGSTKMSVQMAVALGASFALGRGLFGLHWSWMVLTAFIVSSGNRGREDVLHKAVLRVLGAGVGTLSATLLSGLFPAGDAWAIVVIFGVLALATWLRPLNYAFWAAGMTAALALLYGYYGEHGVSMLASRLEAVALGAVVAVAAAWVLFPIRTTDVIRRDIAAALRALDRWLATLVEDPHGAAGAAHGVRRSVAALAPHLSLMRAIPAVLRRRIDHLPALDALERIEKAIAQEPASSPGAVDPGAIERMRSHVAELRRANAEAQLPEPEGWERLVSELGGISAAGPKQTAAAHGEDRFRGSTLKVLGYVNRTHGTTYELGDRRDPDGAGLCYALKGPDGAELRLWWLRERGGEHRTDGEDSPAPQELARGHTPSGFPYVVRHAGVRQPM